MNQFYLPRKNYIKIPKNKENHYTFPLDHAERSHNYIVKKKKKIINQRQPVSILMNVLLAQGKVPLSSPAEAT